MKTLTIREIPPELARAIERRAKEAGSSMSKAVLALIEEGAGVRPRAAKRTYHDLDALAGSWSAEEADEFDAALAAQRTIDEDLWR